VEEIDDRTRDRGFEIIGSLADACDLVLIDSGPMFVAARQWFCATVHDCIDGALIVRDMRHTVAEQVDDVCFRIGECGIHELAVIENFQP
jgi:sensor domain CHASE-containing protein